MKTIEDLSIEELSIDTIRTLAMDAVQKAGSGHPGTPMALAPLAFVLFKNVMKHNPKNPKWFNRDRFLLSNGHASMLLYSSLYLTGYDISLDDIKNYRQWGSKTPGHPEYGLTPGAETTTGPLGQGFLNSIGMAMAEAHLASIFNKENFNLVDHYTYVSCGDGDFMEGASHEAASIAGHFGLGKLIAFYDDNHISIEGPTGITYSDNVEERFKGYNWHVQNIGENINDIDVLMEAIQSAKEEKSKPSLIIMRSHIGYGAPDLQDDPKVHGSPLGEKEIKKTKKFYGWPEDKKFFVPDDVLDYMHEAIAKGKSVETEWNEKFDNYKKQYPDLAKQFEDALNNNIPEDWDKDIPKFEPSDGPMATRGASRNIINGFAAKIPWLMGGSADLAPSTKTLIKSSDYFEKDNYQNRNVAWGIREHNMCGAVNGMTLHGGVKPFASTFFIFSDYARPSIRLAALMELPTIYVLTHDSIGLGGDGPTHQPVEHLASFRAMPNIHVIRPADANETAFAWKAAINRKNGPTMLVLTRQKLPIFDHRKVFSPEGVLKGAYIIQKEDSDKPDVILIASGSEVQLILSAAEQLKKDNINTRVVSMPSWEIFKEQDKKYIEEVLPSNIKKRLAVEAASPFGWREWIGDDGDVIGVDKFGASAEGSDNMKHYGFTVENVVKRTKKLLNK